MATSKIALKTYFQTGDQPTETQFAELVDAVRHVDETVSIVFGQGVRLKKSGNVNQTSDELGDWRIRVAAAGALRFEIYDGSAWNNAQEITAP